MPYYPRRKPMSTRRRNPYRRKYSNYPKTKLNISSRRSFAQNQNRAMLWITRTGFVPASRTNGNILERYGTQDLPSTNMFINACTLYEQYKTIKIHVTWVSVGNITRQSLQTNSRGNVCTYIDTPPLNPSPPTNLVEVANNSSFRLHASDTHMIKRFTQRPKYQYPKWALITRNPTGTPIPAADEWTTTINMLGNNFECTNTQYSNIFYYFKIRYCVLFKCRSDD